MELVKIIGTSHIAQQSIQEIKLAVDQFQPEIIAVELDHERAATLLSKSKNKVSFFEIANIGFLGYLFAKIGQIIQQKLGTSVGVSPGSEMKTALQLAKQKDLKLALIDQPIRITLKNFSKSITWKEKFRFLADLFNGLLFPKKQLQEFGLGNLDLRTVPEEKLVEKLILQLKQRYPNVHRSLVADRNRYMVHQIVRLLRTHKQEKILVVVGAGHKTEMEKLLERVEVI